MSAIPLPERQRELKALAFRIVDILEGAGIPCCGLAGTALGAIRHGDMIPWDDDIDLGVLREDLPQALQALRADPDLFVWDWHVDPLNPTPLLKVLHRISPGISEAARDASVDLFVLDPEPTGALRRRLLAVVLQAIRLAVVYKVSPDAANRTARFRYSPARLLFRMAVAPFSADCLKRLHDRLVLAPRRTTGRRWRSVDYPIHDMLVSTDTDDFARPVHVPFGSREMPVPAHAEAYLTAMYGDWREPPPPENRACHSWDENGSSIVYLPSDSVRMRR